MTLFKDVAVGVIRNNKILWNPSREDLRKMARHEETTSQYGSACYFTKVRNRGAKFTEIVGMKLTKEQEQALKEVREHLKGKRLICMERTMGVHPEMQFKCRTVVPVEYAKIVFMWQEMLFEPNEQADADTTVIFVPEWKEIRILVEPEDGITFVLGSDYFGECKKGHLRMATYQAKRDKGYLGLHAATKKISVLENGKMVGKGFVLFGLSGTGKTSLTVHDHGLSKGVEIIQDDFVIMSRKGYCYGTENGFYLKTEGLDESQRALYKAATSPEAVFENVYVDGEGVIHFKDYRYTTNGRGIIPRAAIPECSKSIDLKRVDFIIFIARRNDVVPPVVRLSAEQAAAAFMLGESIETSAGDPSRAGEAVRCVGTNPFIIGDLHEEGHIFLDILKKNPSMQCFMLNTGAVGGDDITVNDSATILREIARGDIKWKKDPHWKYEIPVSVKGVEKKKLNPMNYYSEQEYRKLVDRLKEEREKWFGKFPELDKSIVTAFS